MEENTQKKKSNAGRKTKYTKKIGEQIAEIYGLGRAKIDEICKQFEINPDTFFEWKKKFPEFSDAILRFQAVRRQNLGELALNGLAILLEKHEYTEEKTLYETETYKDEKTGEIKQRLKVIGIQKTKKVTLPNSRMVEYALNNIKPDEYKNASHIDHTSKGESLGFGSFLQQTKPAPGPGDKQERHKIDIEEEDDVYVPDHRSPKAPF